jgi:hypothetical protein
MSSLLMPEMVVGEADVNARLPGDEFAFAGD